MTTMTDSKAAQVLDRLALGADEPDVHAALTHAIARLREPAGVGGECPHEWQDYGQMNVVRCCKCEARAVTGYEERPFTAPQPPASEVSSGDKRLVSPVKPPADLPDWPPQNWAGMDGAIAWHLIDRHADGWQAVGEMMAAWLAANVPQPPAEAQAQGGGEVMAWRVPVLQSPFGEWLDHGVRDELVLVMHRDTHGWKAAGQGHARLAHQLYVENVEPLCATSHEVAVVGLSGGGWRTVWARSDDDVMHPPPPSAPVGVDGGAMRKALANLVRAGKRFRNTVVETRGVLGMDEHDLALSAAETALAQQPAAVAVDRCPRCGAVRRDYPCCPLPDQQPAAVDGECVDWRAMYRFQTAMRYMDNNPQLTKERAYTMADDDCAALAAQPGGSDNG